MGNCQGDTGDVEDRQRSRSIDELLKNDRKYQQNEVKILLLGAGESGKSTLLKQMKILFSQGFTQEDRNYFHNVIIANLFFTLRSFLEGTKDRNIEVGGDTDAIQKILDSEDDYTDDLWDAAVKLWSDPKFEEAYRANHLTLQIADSSIYFLENMNRIRHSDYLPSDNDILYCRTRTTGVTESIFHIDDAHFKIVDVGGQRSERKKWIHFFQDVTGVIFFVSLSEYDQALFEDANVNRMHESVLLFAEICASKWFTNSALVLFFNKTDLFRKKIEKIDLNVCFPEYKGGCNFDNAVSYLKKAFCTMNKNESKKIFVHLTCATDTQMISKVFASVKESMMMGALLQSV